MSFKVITSIKIVSQQDQILLLLQLEDGDISRLISSHPSLHPQSLLTHMQTFHLEVENFTKNGDKFGWVKYWQMTFNLPNSPKFSPTRILCYMVYSLQTEKQVTQLSLCSVKHVLIAWSCCYIVEPSNTNCVCIMTNITLIKYNIKCMPIMHVDIITVERM